jgi:hypothetical protein
MSESSGSLVKKLAEVMAAVERIPKRGRNDFHKYDYATEADIAATVRKELADRQVMLIPAITGMQRDPVGEKGSVLTTLTMEFTFIDGESGEKITRPWLGAGTDKEDKGAYKAMTGGEKYFLLKTFLMPTGDDPEREDKEQKRERDRVTVKPDRGMKKDRPKLPVSACYINAAVPKSRGNATWLEVSYMDWNGQHLEAIAVIPQVQSLITNVAQENVPVWLTVSNNAKGHAQIDMVERWKPEQPPSAVDEMPTAAEVF